MLLRIHKESIYTFERLVIFLDLLLYIIFYTPYSAFILMRLAVHHKSSVNFSSVGLQILLKCNVYFSFTVFVFVLCFNFITKVRRGMWEVERAWYGCLVVLWILLEGPRLFLGFRGNLNFSVSALVGFIMVTIIADVPLMIVYNLIVPMKNPLDHSISVVQLSLAAVEIVLAVRQLIKTIRNNTYDFYVLLGACIEE